MQRSLKELDAACEAAKAAAAQRELLAEHLPLQAEPLADPIPEPEQSPEEIARQLPTLQASRRELQSQLDRLLGQIRAIGSPDELRTRLQEDETRLTALQQEYDAIALAMQALSAANTTLQNRFSPRSAHGRRRSSPRSPADGTTRCCSAVTLPSPPSPAAMPPRAASSC